ncbi:MAG: hypothetical protein RL410_959 [Actinomycetota bacterium]|jgi:dolichyl-phosphate-mannose--protein O-mannosyl transferase
MKMARGWWQSLTLMAIAAGLRLPYLGQPHAVVFDETYYVKDGFSLWKFGYERDAVDQANELMLSGNTDIFKASGSYVVHPPVGKWVIGFGEQLFGLNPFGWRFMVCMLGIFAVVLVHRIARRLFKHELTAFLAGLFMAIDGVAIVLSRTALLDQVLMFFLLCGFGAVVLDRDWVLARLEASRGLGMRPWLLVATVCLGLALGTKWSAAYFIVANALIVVFFTARTRISLGHEKAWKTAILRDTLKWLPVVVIAIISIYIACWSGWLLNDGGYLRHWAEANPGDGITWLPEALRSLVQYHVGAWNFHLGLTSPHSYSANPWTWPLQLRPTSFYYEQFGRGQSGCDSDSCAAEVVALGNPVIWWAATLAILHQIWRSVVQRETRSVAVVAMFMAGWAPWLMYQHRTIFSFYSIVMIPFMAMALAASLGVILGPADAGAALRKKRSFAVGAFVLLTVVVSYFMMPVWTGEVVAYDYWHLHMWLPSWI